MNESVGPHQMTHIAQKVNHVDEKVTSLESEYRDLVSKVVPTMAKHSIIHVIVGGALVLMVPICATWIFKMTEQVSDMNRSVIILEERSRIYDEVPHTQTGILGVGNYWKIHRRGEPDSVVSRTAVETESGQRILYSDGELPRNLQF